MNYSSSIMMSRALSRVVQVSKRKPQLLWNRSFSNECEPAQRLREVFQEYRQMHFSREIPTRFRKEVLKTIEGPDKSINAASLNEMLANIGRSDACLSEQDYQILLKETGAVDGKIPAHKALELL